MSHLQFTDCSGMSFIFTQTNLPIFKLKDSNVTRRYSDFEWLKNELERDSKVSDANKTYSRFVADFFF